MKTLPYVIILCLCLAACHAVSTTDLRLSQAEQLVETDADSVIQLLDEIPLNGIENQEQAMRYALVKQEAVYTIHKQVDDSIVDCIYNYYRPRQSSTKFPMASLLKAYSLLRHEVYDSALMLLKGIDSRTSELGQGYFRGFYHWMLGKIYSINELPDSAHAHYRQEAHFAKMTGNKSHYLNSLQHYAVSFWLREEYDSARYYLETVCRRDLSDVPVELSMNFWGNLTSLYLAHFPDQFNQIDSLISALQPQSLSDSLFVFTLKASYLYRIDSCILADSLSQIVQQYTDDAYMLKALYKRRYSYYKDKEPKDSALLFAQRYQELNDSLANIPQTAKLMALSNQHDLETMRDKSRHNLWTAILIAGGIILLIAGGTYQQLSVRSKRESQLHELLHLTPESTELDIVLRQCLAQLQAEENTQLHLQLKAASTHPIDPEERKHILDRLHQLCTPGLTWFARQYPSMNQDDVLFSLLNYMRIDRAACANILDRSKAALKQRRMRIKEKLDAQTFETLFPE
jgi:hypothetical protein